MRSRILQYSIIAICISIILINLSDKLIFYIHPRYITFTIGFVSLAVLILVIDLVLTKKDYEISKSGWIVVFIAVISILLPPKTLSQNIAVNRLGQPQLSSSPTIQSSFDSFSTDLTRFTILEWSNLLNSNPSSSQIVGKSAKLSGFIIKDDSGQNYVARYKLTCCAVDATPITVPISGNEVNELIQGQWVEIEGEMISLESKNHPFQLNINKIIKIEEPESPYVY